MRDTARTIRIPDHIGYERVEGDFVLVNLKSGKFLGLDAVGSLLWQTLLDGGTVDDAVGKILGRYEVAEDRARQDIESLLGKLEEKGAVVIRAEQP